MKHFFIVNPVAGKGKMQRKLLAELERRGLDYYVTKSVGDGERYVRSVCEDGGEETMRFYACGGDGTLNEVANGAFGFSHAEIACLPLGSGNDFIRNFDIDAKDFWDIEKQMAGIARPSDLIEYEDTGAEGSGKRVAINMFNIGFDCNVVAKAVEVKKYTMLRGSLAYLLAVLLVLIKKETMRLCIRFDDQTKHEGAVLLTAVANGCFCGGGIKGLPRAIFDDGKIDVEIIENASRRTFLSLLPKYIKGTHLSDRKARRIIRYKQCESLTIEPCAGQMFLCADGEITTVNKVTFKNLRHAIQFSLPLPLGIRD